MGSSLLSPGQLKNLPYDLREEYMRAIHQGNAFAGPGHAIYTGSTGARIYGNTVGAQQAPTEPICSVSVYRAANTVSDPLHLLMMRLRKDNIPASAFEHIHIAVMPEKTFVTLYKDNAMTTLEDSTAMFPSDNLVSSLRLVLE